MTGEPLQSVVNRLVDGTGLRGLRREAMSVDRSLLNAAFRVKLESLIQLLLDNDMGMKMTDGFRSFKRQQELFDHRPRLTRAKPGQSPHNYGLAVDFCFDRTEKPYVGDWAKFGRLVKEAGLEWGGGWLLFKDKPHVQMAKWRQYK